MPIGNGSTKFQQTNNYAQQNLNQNIRYKPNTAHAQHQQHQQQTMHQQQYIPSTQPHGYAQPAPYSPYQQVSPQYQQSRNIYASQQQYNYQGNNGGHTVPPTKQGRPDDGNKYAVAALISGIIAFLIGITVLGGFLFGIAALVLAYKRSKQYKLCYGNSEPIDVPMTVPSKAKERIARVLGIIGIVEAIVVLIFCSLFADIIFPNANVEETASNLGDSSVYVAEDNDTTETVESADVVPLTVEGTIENPAAIGEWLETVVYLSDDGTYETIYYRITSVDTNDETVQATIDEYNADDDSYYTIDAISGDYSDELHYITVTYEIYVPTTISTSGGIPIPDLSFTLLGADGGALEANGYTYQGLGGTDVTVDAPNLIYAGETYTGTYVFVAPIAATNALIQSATEDVEANTIATNTLVDLTATITSSEVAENTVSVEQ